MSLTQGFLVDLIITLYEVISDIRSNNGVKLVITIARL